ncbi:hypothetical protein AVEN_325-1 [Araneus ventricosus]|uniref:Uncharacterized protein n=1 Tax=Araneus ventricosus TaxID=182803 RepID=A0A4Y2HZZ6_ARAVE|nr:hypothetical protein AVEN_325-1 [Araneus ventricosus]
MFALYRHSSGHLRNLIRSSWLSSKQVLALLVGTIMVGFRSLYTDDVMYLLREVLGRGRRWLLELHPQLPTVFVGLSFRYPRIPSMTAVARLVLTASFKV